MNSVWYTRTFFLIIQEPENVSTITFPNICDVWAKLSFKILLFSDVVNVDSC